MTEQREPKMSSDGARAKFLEYLLLAVPIAIVDGLVLALKDKFFSQPWQAIFVVAPLGIFLIGWIVWKERTGQTPLIGRSYLVILSLYVLIFSVCAGTDILNYKRTLVGYEEAVPTNFLSLNRLGDWRYWFARRTSPPKDLAIVLVDPEQDNKDSEGALAARRLEVAGLIKLAVKQGAKGIAFDFYFQKDSLPEADKMLCDEITNATNRNVPVLVGFPLGFTSDNGEPFRGDIAPSLAPCITLARQGHLVGYSESDHRVRMVPLYFKKDPTLPSLSLKIAQLLQANMALPSDGLVQFIKPQNDYPEIRYADLFEPNEAKRNNERLKLRDKFLLVGEETEQDTFNTPYGKTAGVVIHAWTVHSLRENHRFERTPWWSTLFEILLFCYATALMFDRNMRLSSIVGYCLLASILACVSSVIAVWFWAKWIDAIYSLLAIWLLFLLFWILKRMRRQQPT